MRFKTFKAVGTLVGIGLMTLAVRTQAPPLQLDQLVLTVGHSEIITAPGNTNTRSIQIIKIQSSNPSVATAERYGTNQIQIVAIAPGKTIVQFYDNLIKRQYNQPVWVQAAHATGGGGAGSDQTRTQLEQIVMLPKRTEIVTVPGSAPQLSSVLSSNPSVATGRTNTRNTIQVYSIALGDTWINFADNTSSTQYQVHVWVVNNPNFIPPAQPGPAPTTVGSTDGVGRLKPSADAASPETELFNNFNTGITLNGPRRGTVFTLNRSATITALITYHWNNGRGARPGTIGLRDQKGKIYGPFAAAGSSGQGGAANVDWTAQANVTVPAGTYAVVDSSPGTWSSNAESALAGFAKVRGYFVTAKPEHPGVQIALLPYGSDGYRYLIVPNGQTLPGNFSDPGFDDSRWAAGRAAFSNDASDCQKPLPIATVWESNSRLLTRKRVTVPSGASNIEIFIAVDNDIEKVFFNGAEVRAAYKHSGCPLSDSYSVLIPQHLVKTGENLIAVQAFDFGFYTFFDMRIIATTPR